MDTIKKIHDQIKKNLILLYMKGSPKFPKCGFSEKAVNCIINCNVRFGYIDVLEHKYIRLQLPKISNWPTFPQLWVNGKFIGGSDIVVEMYNNGELKNILNNVYKIKKF